MHEKMNMRLSKSKFVAGCQCVKRLYWQVHEPELAAQPDAATDAIIEQGREVGLLARQMFPGGIEVSGNGGLYQAIRATRELVANPAVPAIYEATFEHAGVLVRIDVLQRRRDRRWRMVEVKSSTDLREDAFHIEDLGIQYRVLRRSGLDVASACLVHINRGYVYQGGDIDVRRFFKIRNVTRRVEKLQHDITFRLRAQFAIINMPSAPDIRPGKQCGSPIVCEFYDHCNPPRPDDHIGYLPRIHASALDELEEMGISPVRLHACRPESRGLAGNCLGNWRSWSIRFISLTSRRSTLRSHALQECVLTIICVFNTPRIWFANRVRRRSITNSLPPMPAIPGASSSSRYAPRWVKAAASSYIPRSSLSAFQNLPVGFLSSLIKSMRSKPAYSICYLLCGTIPTIRHTQDRIPSNRCCLRSYRR
jgi:hypothetical protein